jgi:hypothetical protein
MLATATAKIDELICDSLRGTDEANLRRNYSEHDEFVIVEEFLSREVLSRWQMEGASPLKEGESRYIVSMQYVTAGEMNPFMRFISNMKDVVAYFGLRGVFGKGKVR